MLSNRGAGEDSWESLGQQQDQASRSIGNQHWISIGETDCCRRWSPNTLATWCEEPSLWKRSWDAGKDWRQKGEEDGRGWDG